MTNNNDQRILKLKEQILAKKEKIGKIGRFNAITTCLIHFEGTQLNLNVLTKEQLIVLLVKLNSYLNSAKELGFVNQFTISGFKLEDWMTDVKSKLDILSKKDEERALKLMEAKLTQLLSEEKQVELELDGIESLLKD